MADEDIPDDEILPEHHPRGGVRGQSAERHAAGTDGVPLGPGAAEVFPSAESAERALRAVVQAIKDQAQHSTA